jgi:hypothetical protein
MTCRHPCTVRRIQNEIYSQESSSTALAIESAAALTTCSPSSTSTLGVASGVPGHRGGGGAAAGLVVVAFVICVRTSLRSTLLLRSAQRYYCCGAWKQALAKGHLPRRW